MIEITTSNSTKVKPDFGRGYHTILPLVGLSFMLLPFHLDGAESSTDRFLRDEAMIQRNVSQAWIVNTGVKNR
jgi:hypothetical protein